MAELSKPGMIAYLDNSATTRPTEGVVLRMARAMRDEYFNPSSMYAPALIPEKAMNECRDKLRAALMTRDAQVIFTSGGTEANNLALMGVCGLARAPVRAAVSAAEHASVLAAADALEKRGAQIVRLGVDARGQIDIEQLEKALAAGLTLVSCMQVNNETGALADIERLSRAVRAYPGTLLHVDGVQGFMRQPLDFKLIDLYTLSAHKIHGPKGAGALIARKGVRLAPLHMGGGQEGALRGGTENTPGIMGLMQAIDDMRALGDTRDMLMRKKLKLIARMREGAPELIINGPEPEAGAAHIVNISFPGVGGEVMLHALEAKGVLCSTGAACSSKKRRLSHVLTSMGVPAERAECALRFSLSPLTSDDEIELAASAVNELYPALKRFQRR